MKFKTKPVVVEAFQMTKENQVNENCEWPSWLIKAWTKGAYEIGCVYSIRGEGKRLRVVTREGHRTVDLDDWIIQGVKGELYPCKPDIFEMTYDRVE